MAVYLDYNATTPIDFDVEKEICSTLTKVWGNPSSSYKLGKEAKDVIENSRLSIADMINATSQEIVFTSGGTESNNIVIHTIIKEYALELKSSVSNDIYKIPHIITTNIEHDSIKLPLEVLLKEGKINVTFIPVSKVTGAVDVQDIINEIRPNTRLITVMLANNETGVIQPVSQIRQYLMSCDKKVSKNIYIHSDAAQAIGKINVDVQELNIDYLTIVGHKFYGPRIGALFFRKSCPLYPMFYGGGQEQNYRPGTENVCMVAGLGKAASLVSLNISRYHKHMKIMKEYLEECLISEFGDKIVLNLKSSLKLCNTLSVAFNFNNINGWQLLQEADNVYASTCAACHVGGKPSAVLIASGVSEELASKTLRLSVGRETTKQDIDVAVKYLKEAVFKLLK